MNEEIENNGTAAAEAETPAAPENETPIEAEAETETKTTAEVEEQTPESEKKPKAKKVDYAQESYECFIKNADPDTTDADPVAAIQRVFDRRASEDLKARVAAEGKTAEGAYAFLWSVARKMPRTNNGCHISPETGYAIAMHYFEDVPACAEWEPKLKKEQEAREAAERKAAERKAAEAARKANEAKKGAAKRKGKAKVKKVAESVADAVETSESVAVEAPVAVPAPEPEAKEPEVAEPETPKVTEHPQEERDRANGQGFLFDGI